MRRPAVPHPDQLPLIFESAAELERVIETRVAARCEAESFYWRFRLVVVESILLSILVAAAGFALDQPAPGVIRAAALIGMSCLLTGLMLIGLSAFAARLWARLRRGRTR